eukprot:15094632-Ditylum_brightwellii.AAC.1
MLLMLRAAVRTVINAVFGLKVSMLRREWRIKGGIRMTLLRINSLVVLVGGADWTLLEVARERMTLSAGTAFSSQSWSTLEETSK